jgi:hypothetical protein
MESKATGHSAEFLEFVRGHLAEFALIKEF